MSNKRQMPKIKEETMKLLKVSNFVLLLMSSSAITCKQAYAAELTVCTSPSEIISGETLPVPPSNEERDWTRSVELTGAEAEPNLLELNKAGDCSQAAASLLPAVSASKAAAPQDESAAETTKIADAELPVGSRRIVSDPAEAPGAIEELTRQIILKEIALEKFNINYRLNSARQGRWKGWRYAAANEANAALSIAGGIIGIEQRGSHLHRSNKVKNYVQERANWIPMVGTCISAAAAVTEFGINEWHSYEAYTKGFSPGKAREHVNSLKADINRLLAERDALISLEKSAPLLSGRVEVDELEGKVLSDLRDQNLLEYQRFHINARRLLAFQQCQYLFDFAKNVTNGLGYDFAYLALHRHRRPWNFRAGLLFDVSGGLTMAGPIVSRLYGKVVSEYGKHYTKRSVEGAESQELGKLEQDQKALEAAIKRNGTDGTAKSVERLSMYGENSKHLQDTALGALKEINKAKLVATQNIGAGLYVGGSKLASGILFTIPGYLHSYNINKNQTADRVTNHLLFASSVVGLQASAFSFLDTLRIQVAGEINRHKLSAQGKLPGQVAKARLAQLDSLEAKLKAAQPQ